MSAQTPQLFATNPLGPVVSEQDARFGADPRTLDANRSLADITDIGCAIVRRPAFTARPRYASTATVQAAGADGQRARVLTGPDGRYRLAFRVTEGMNVVRLAVSDAAGNVARATRRTVRDTRAPRLALTGLDGPLGTAEPTVRGRVRVGRPRSRSSASTVGPPRPSRSECAAGAFRSD